MTCNMLQLEKSKMILEFMCVCVRALGKRGIYIQYSEWFFYRKQKHLIRNIFCIKMIYLFKKKIKFLEFTNKLLVSPRGLPLVSKISFYIFFLVYRI